MSLDAPDATDFHVVSPYCGEPVDVYFEPDVQGSLMIHSEVCCHPWQVQTTRDGEYRYDADGRPVRFLGAFDPRGQGLAAGPDDWSS